MGGHGGLNILPQKSWNVYGRENRLKVSRDEAAHTEIEKVVAAKQKQADAEQKRVLLLQRARQRNSQPSEEPASYDLAAAVPAETAEQPRPQALQHFSLFPEAALEDDNPEVAEEKKAEAKRRGNKDTQTSDARFDAGFSFANAMGGKASHPWYTRPSLTLDEAVQPAASTVLQLPASQEPALPNSQHRHRDKDTTSKHKKSRGKDKRKHKRSRQRDAESLLGKLREERQAREASERSRQHAMIRGMQPVDARCMLYFCVL